MAIKAFFIPQGMVIGDVTETLNKTIKVTNPALIVTRQNEVILAPLLHLVEERELEIELSELAFKTVFTPKRELVNHYNQIYGSGLVLSESIPKNLRQ